MKDRVMKKWAIMTLAGRGPIVAGADVHGGLRLSTPLVAVEAAEGRCHTVSGAVYRLEGQEDREAAVDTVIVFGMLVGAADLHFCECWQEVVDLIAANGNVAGSVTEEQEEQRKRDRLVLASRQVAQGLATADRLHGISVLDVARGTHLSVDDILAFASGEIGRISMVDADDLMRLVGEVVSGGVAPQRGGRQW